MPTHHNLCAETLAAEGKVPYDRETAQSAVRQFLATKHDGGKFQRKLVDALKKGGGKG